MYYLFIHSNTKSKKLVCVQHGRVLGLNRHYSIFNALDLLSLERSCLFPNIVAQPTTKAKGTQKQNKIFLLYFYLNIFCSLIFCHSFIPSHVIHSLASHSAFSKNLNRKQNNLIFFLLASHLLTFVVSRTPIFFRETGRLQRYKLLIAH